MVLTRWDPLFELRRMHRLMDRPWHGAPSHFSGDINQRNGHGWAIPLDVVRDGDSITLKASMPGVNPDDIDVTIEDGVLTIKAETKKEDERKEGDYVVHERRSGSFRRALRLPDNVDADRAEPHYENGVLTVTLPVAESKKAKQLKVTAGKSLEAPVSEAPIAEEAV